MMYQHPILGRYVFVANMIQGRVIAGSVGLGDKVTAQKRLNKLNIAEEAWLVTNKGNTDIIKKLRSYIQQNSNRTGGIDTDMLTLAIKHYKRIK